MALHLQFLLAHTADFRPEHWVRLVPGLMRKLEGDVRRVQRAVDGTAWGGGGGTVFLPRVLVLRSVFVSCVGLPEWTVLLCVLFV